MRLGTPQRRGDHPRQREKTAIADVHDACRRRRVLLEVAGNEGQARHQQAADKHGEQRAFGIGAALASGQPAGQQRAEEAEVEQDVGQGKGQRAEGETGQDECLAKGNQGTAGRYRAAAPGCG